MNRMKKMLLSFAVCVGIVGGWLMTDTQPVQASKLLPGHFTDAQKTVCNCANDTYPQPTTDCYCYIADKPNNEE